MAPEMETTACCRRDFPEPTVAATTVCSPRDCPVEPTESVATKPDACSRQDCAEETIALAEAALIPLLQRQQFVLVETVHWIRQILLRRNLLHRQQLVFVETVQWSRQSLLQRNPVFGLAEIAPKQQLLALAQTDLIPLLQRQQLAFIETAR